MGITMLDTSVFGALNRANSALEIAKDLHQLGAGGETLMVGASAHQEILRTPDVSLRNAQLSQIKDFNIQVQQAATAAEHTIGEDFVNRVVSKDGTKINLRALGLEIKDLAIGSDVKVQMARTPNQKVKLFTVERMVKNRVTITRNFAIEFSERSRVLPNMGNRIPYDPEKLGVTPAPSAPKPVPEVPPPAAPEVPTGKPRGGSIGFMKRFGAGFKTGFKAGMRDYFRTTGVMGHFFLLMTAAELLLEIADAVAAKEAKEKIAVFFIKEGFAKGYAAAAMGWTEKNIEMEALNRVTSIRLQGMGDAAGKVGLTEMLEVAKYCENMAVAYGWNYANNKSMAWKKEVVTRGMNRLKSFGISPIRLGLNPRDPEDERFLFEYKFLVNIAWVLRRETDLIVGPLIRIK